jgi:methylglutaconyl-CoA hydratase
MAQVNSSIQGFIQTIEFSSEHHNSLPTAVLSKLVDEIEHAGKNPDVYLIILKSGGDRTFCAGANFDELIQIEDEDQGSEFFSGFANVILACKNCPKIIIGRIQGKAIGGGVGIAAATDYCMATQYSSIRLSELAVGIGPFVIGPAVVRKMGVSAYSQMSLNPSEWQTAQWAKEKGLYHEVFSDIEQLDAYIEYFCKNLLQYNPAALTALKQVFWEDTQDWEHLLDQRTRISGELILSDFAKNAIANFKAKL